MSQIKHQVKRGLLAALTRTWLRPGAVRRAVAGPYRGLAFALTPPMMSRLDAFFREYEANVTAWLRQHAQPGQVVWDVGAHVGIHALYAGRLVGAGGRVVAFEGWPDNLDGLRHNIAANPGMGAVVTVAPVCIARAAGTVQMARGASDGKHHLAGGGETDVVTVAATTFDVYWQQSGFCPDLILIDIEGYERDALDGGAALFAACHPRLALEHHGRIDTLLDWLTAHSYTVETVDKRHIFAS